MVPGVGLFLQRQRLASILDSLGVKCVMSTPETSVPLWKTVDTYFMPCVRTLTVKSESSHLKFSFPIPFLVRFKGLVFLSLKLNKIVPAEPSALPQGPITHGSRDGKVERAPWENVHRLKVCPCDLRSAIQTVSELASVTLSEYTHE